MPNPTSTMPAMTYYFRYQTDRVRFQYCAKKVRVENMEQIVSGNVKLEFHDPQSVEDY